VVGGWFELLELVSETWSVADPEQAEAAIATTANPIDAPTLRLADPRLDPMSAWRRIIRDSPGGPLGDRE
jgi:hypothetical protein